MRRVLHERDQAAALLRRVLGRVPLRVKTLLETRMSAREVLALQAGERVPIRMEIPRDPSAGLPIDAIREDLATARAVIDARPPDPQEDQLPADSEQLGLF